LRHHPWTLWATSMAVLSVNEVLPRGYSHQLGGSPTASMVFVATLDGTTTQSDVLSAVGYVLGDTHPEFSYLKCSGIEVTENDRWHAEVQLAFSVPPSANLDEPGSIPFALPDVWTFSTGTGQVACTKYFPDANDNVLTAALQNKAFDPYEGITVAEPELRVTISGYRQLFPATIAVRLTGAINSSTYAGGKAHTWQCAGISGTPERQVIGAQLVEYWQITSELIYRKSTHDLFLPNAGLNYLKNGQPNNKRRCWVINEDGEKVPSAGPVALAENGTIKQEGAGPYPPDILTFRIYPEENFTEFFGVPPATVTFA
jgi:hypothetical protein